MNSLNLLNLIPGDIIWRRKGVFIHVGLYMGRGLVFHNTPEQGEHVSSLTEFAGGQPIGLRRRTLVDEYQLNMVVHLAMKARRSYHAIANNCEHSVERIISGIPKSEQLQGWAVLGVLALLLMI